MVEPRITTTEDIMKRHLLLLVVALLVLGGCAYRISEIPTAHLEPDCVRQCSQSYSDCVSRGNQVGFKTETLRACRDSYEICVNTCEVMR